MVCSRKLLLTLLALYATGGCRPGAAPVVKTTPPAKVANVAKEEQLNTIQLTAEAEERLGLILSPVELRQVERVRTYGGEIALPPGASIIVSSPVGGTLHAPKGHAVPKVGSQLVRRQPMFELLPLLSPERAVLTPAERVNYAQARNTIAASQIDAEGQVQQAKVQVEAAQIVVDRAERLFREQAGTARAVDDAKAQLSLAQKTLEAATSRKKLLDNIKLDEEVGTQTPLLIESPQQGMLRTAHVAAGEVVAAGAPLFEVMQFDPIWVKASVYVGELPDVDLEKEAEISGLAGPRDMAVYPARPIVAPPTATALASSVDLYYELKNPDAIFRPAQRVSLKLRLRGDHESTVLPWSAVILDVNGGTWVYVRSAPHTFSRQRVQVRYVVGNLAVIDKGPAVGTQVVSAGAIELFGTEFGFAK